MRRHDMISEQFYKDCGRFAGPVIDYTELNRGMQSFSYSFDSVGYEKMYLDVIYYVPYDNKLTFTFRVSSFDLDQQITNVGDTPADRFTNAFLYRLDLYSINQERDNRFMGADDRYYFNIPTPINIKYAPQSYFYTHHKMKDIVFMTDLMMDVFYGDNKYKLDKDRINNDEYLSKIQTIQDKLIAIEEDFK